MSPKCCLNKQGLKFFSSFHLLTHQDLENNEFFKEESWLYMQCVSFTTAISSRNNIQYIKLNSI